MAKSKKAATAPVDLAAVYQALDRVQAIIEFDFLTREERFVGTFPSPDELWSRLRAGRSIADDRVAEQLLTPCFHKPDQKLRYYQDIAINRVVEAVLVGRRRILLTMATGTGKTLTAFQICWKLWNLNL